MISVLISFNSLVMHVTKIVFSFVTKLDIRNTIIGIITIGYCMLSNKLGIEIVTIKKNFSFLFK